MPGNNVTPNFLTSEWGLNPNFAKLIAEFIGYLNAEDLQPRITSGFRDPKKQDAMREKWDAELQIAKKNNPQANESEIRNLIRAATGLRARPAVDSLHVRVKQGKPDARAIDIKTTDDARAAEIAKAHGIGAGLYFSKPDPGHYYDLSGRLEKIVGGSILVVAAAGVAIFYFLKKARIT